MLCVVKQKSPSINRVSPACYTIYCSGRC